MKDSDAMEMPFSSTVPPKLYTLLLRLRPLQRGTLMPFSGKLVHGAFLNWLRSAAPDVVAWLHDGNKRRLFTCSSLQFPLPVLRMLEAKRENTHLPLDPEKPYLIPTGWTGFTSLTELVEQVNASCFCVKVL